ncbi:MAG TPA: SRPBCC domain-containing protein [Bacteroidota bacterium]|nr:SRPBCC domain-containing protein [Bacteroidota bacterium]
MEMKDKGVIITRLFGAPRELVWKAWTDPRHLMRWWGPKHYTSPHCTIDLKVGGKRFWCMEAPDGTKHWTVGQYREIVPIERFVYTDQFADEKGNVVPPSYYGFPDDWPGEMLVTVTLEAIGGKTRMTVEHLGLPKGKLSSMAAEGWKESFDKLAETIKPYKEERA